VNQDPIDALFRTGFTAEAFPDLFWPVLIASLVLFAGTIVLYMVQTRRLRRHPPLMALQEWLFWTGLAVFGLLIVSAIFKFILVIVLGTVIVGLITFVWVRFFYFPPQIEAYNAQLRRARFLAQSKYRNPEATIRSRSSRPARKRRRG
jgi:hypothetical protein